MQSTPFLDFCHKNKEYLEEKYPNRSLAIDLEEETGIGVVVIAEEKEEIFIERLKELEKQTGKRYRTLHTDGLKLLINDIFKVIGNTVD